MKAVSISRASLLNENLVQLMYKVSLPAIVGMFVIGLYSFVDAIFVGQWINESAVGAVSIAYPFTLINNGIGALIGMGSASLLSRAIGEGNKETIKKIMSNLLILTFICSFFTCLVGFFFTEELLSLTHIKGKVLDYAVRYLKIIFLGSLFINFAQAANMVIRGEGKMLTAMSIMAIGAILNILLTPIFIKILGYGIEGAAVATVISQLAQFLITIVYFLKFSPEVKFHQLKLESSIISPVLSVGFSAMIMQIMSFVQQTFLFSTLAKYGDEKIILMGAVMRYMMLSFIPVWGISQGFQPVAGTNFGANNYERVKKATIIFSLGAGILASIFWGGFMFFTEDILSWFITQEASIITEGLTEARIALIAFPITGFLIIFLTLFQSIGDAKKAGILVMLRQILLFIPLLYILPQCANLNSTGAFLSFAVTDVVIFFFSLFFVRKVFKSFTQNQKHSLMPHQC